MSKGLLAARAYLTDWAEYARAVQPLRSIVWISGGARNNESMVTHHLRVMMEDVRERNPDIRHELYTNCVDVSGWPWSYVVPKEMIPVANRHVFWTQVASVVSWLLNESMPDLFVVNGIAAAAALYGVALYHMNEPLPPVICIYAKSPEELWDYSPDFAAERILYSLARLSNFWIFTLDNKHEYDLAKSMIARCGVPDFAAIRRVKTYDFGGVKPVECSKEDVVMWSGRMSTMKNPKLAAEIFAMMGDSAIRRRVFVPQVGGGVASIWPDGVEVECGLPGDVYRKEAARSKVILITLRAEGMPIGFIEVVARGVVPVVYRQPWALDLFPPDWPLYFDTTGEAIDKIEEALADYERYRKEILRWVSVRFAGGCNAHELIEEVWYSYLMSLGDRVRLVAQRGESKSL